MKDNVAGALAYITIIPAIIFLVMEPYNKSPFVRFHAYQCLVLYGAMFVLRFVLGFAVSMAGLGGLLLLPIYGLLGLGFLAAWIVCVMKAYQEQQFKLPVIGDFASQLANK